MMISLLQKILFPSNVSRPIARLLFSKILETCCLVITFKFFGIFVKYAIADDCLTPLETVLSNLETPVRS